MIELCEIEKCTGCSACFNVCNHNAIQMGESSEGFRYPIINPNKCVSCGLCNKVCPQIITNNTNLIRNNIKKCYAGYALSKKIRCNSSSGGIFTSIAEYIIDNNGIAVGAYLNHNELSHYIVSNKQELYKLQGSKYFQSNIGYIYKQIKIELKYGRSVLFCGTPCQIAGLKQYLQNNDISKLLLCDFICHGVPSHLVFKKLIKECQIQNDIYFRDIRGWGIGFYLKKRFLEGYILKHLNGKESFFFHAYLSGYMNRECCYQCSYANTKRVSDITLADYWGITEKAPLTKKKMKKGVSFISINTQKGEKILKAIQSNLFLQERDLDEIIKNNAQLTHPAQRPNERSTFYDLLSTKSWTELLQYFHFNPPTISLKGRIRELKKMILSFQTK